MALTLLIADTSEEFRLALQSVLSDAYEITLCSDGSQALEAARELRPDVIVLDLMLTEMDGLTLLHKIRSLGQRPMVLAVTCFLNDYILQAAQELGIGYIIRKPCSCAAVSQRVRDLTKRMNPLPPPLNPEAYTTEQLKKLLFSSRHKGFELLINAVQLMCRQPDISITKELYPKLGLPSGSSSMQVERAIRSAINAAWNQKHTALWHDLFPPGPDGIIPRPSNGAFISRLADELREKLAAEQEK